MSVNIVNCLLTRKCNLNCHYCQISGNIDQPLRPDCYPGSKYYYENEKDATWWIKTLKQYHAANPDVFFILYGGEPFLRWEMLAELVNELNKINAAYTIISSCNGGIRKQIDKFFEKVEYVCGFTASIDPTANLLVEYDRETCNDDEVYKSMTGYWTLKELMNKGLVKDPVAEITCDYESIYRLEDLIKQLTEDGITADVTMIDIAKSNYYDFSNIYGHESLVKPKPEVREVFDNLKNSNYLIHMKDTLLDAIYDNLPSNVDCELENGLTNVTIDADGTQRLCLRIKGNHTIKFNADETFTDSGEKHEKYDELFEAMCEDKRVLCNKCMWSCVLMSKSGNCDGIINH